MTRWQRELVAWWAAALLQLAGMVLYAHGLYLLAGLAAGIGIEVVRLFYPHADGAR